MRYHLIVVLILHQESRYIYFYYQHPQPLYLYLSRLGFLVSFANPNKQLFNVKFVFEFLNYRFSV